MIGGHCAGQPLNRAARERIPVRRAQTDKGGDKINARAVGNCGRHGFGLARFSKQVQTVPQPLNDRSADKDRAFQHIGGAVTELPTNGCQQSRFRIDRRLARVHQQKSARSVSVFDVTRVKTALPEQRRLLIPRRAGNRNAFPEQMLGCIAEYAGGRLDLGQDCLRNAEQIEQIAIPRPCVNVVQHGARRIGGVCRVDFSARQIPDQPTVHRAEAQFPCFRATACVGDVFQNPLQFGCRKIRVGNQSGFGMEY